MHYWFCVAVCVVGVVFDNVRLWLRVAPCMCLQVLFTCALDTQWAKVVNRAHGVVVSHPLRMRKALGSIPSVSIICCHALVDGAPALSVDLLVSFCTLAGVRLQSRGRIESVAWRHLVDAGAQGVRKLEGRWQAEVQCLHHCLARRDFHALKILLAKRNFERC